MSEVEASQPVCARRTELAGQVRELQRQVAELTAGLHGNSSNSSRPPSSDPPPAPKPPPRPPAGRPRGGQQGPPGHPRRLLPPGRVGRGVDHVPSACRGCGAAGPTDNHAERCPRPAVLWRKNSFGSASDRGCRFVERRLTVVTTLRLRGKGVLDFLRRTLEAHRLGRPAPSPLA